MQSMGTELPSTFKFLWKIDNFSKFTNQVFHFSDVFNAGGVKWKVKMYPKGKDEVYDHLSIFLVPAEPINFPVDAEYSFAITSQTTPRNTVRCEGKNQFVPGGSGWGFKKFMSLSQLHDSKKGYILNDSFEIRVEVKVGFGAGQLFKWDQKDCEGSGLASELFEDIGGFSILKKQAPSYKKIWLKYGHIPSTNVLPALCYSSLVMLVNDLMDSIMDMHHCRYADLSSEKIDLWDLKIEMAEKLKFNVKWLRKQLECVKNELGGILKSKAELVDQSRTCQAAKSRVKAIGDVLGIAETPSEAKELGEKVSALLIESDMEMHFFLMQMEFYLESGEDLVFHGMFCFSWNVLEF